MLEYYGITIPGACDLKREIPNPTHNYLLGLYDLANAYIHSDRAFKELSGDSIDHKRWMCRQTVEL
jgi:hypothetical protein